MCSGNILKQYITVLYPKVRALKFSDNVRLILRLDEEVENLVVMFDHPTMGGRASLWRKQANALISVRDLRLIGNSKNIRIVGKIKDLWASDKKAATAKFLSDVAQKLKSYEIEYTKEEFDNIIIIEKK